MSSDRDEVTIKDIFLKLKEWFFLLLSKWIWIVAAGLIIGILSLAYFWNQKPKYTADLSFILSNNSSGSSGLYSLANQIGLDLNSNSDAFSGDNIIAIMTSQTMVEQALLRKPPSQNEILINIFAKSQEYDKGWSKKPRTANSFPFPSDINKMTYVQDSLVRDIYNDIVQNYLTVSRPDKDISVYKVSTVSKNEIFSLYLTTYLVEVTSKFYIDTKTSIARANLNMLLHESDSIHTILRTSLSSSAQAFDYTYNLNPAFQAQRVPAQEAQLTGTALGTAYSEVLRNLELAKISLLKETPLYQILDQPHLPLLAEKTGRLFALVVGGLAGGFFMILFFILKSLVASSK